MSKEKLFSFKVDKYDLEVVSFKGTQAVSELYRYDIELISKDANIDFDDMLKAEVCLVLHNKDKEDTYVHGVLENFEAYQKVDEYIYYRATLVPKLWWLSIAHDQQIFLNKKIDEVLEKILKQSRFTSNDYEFRLKESYDKREYICQYKESRYDFISRWMQRDGLYFYFEQDEDGCKLIITDAKEKQQMAPVSEELFYRPNSGLQSYTDQAVSSIIYRSNNTIKSVQMKNFNYEKPLQDIHSSKSLKGENFTQTYMFGHNILSQEEVTRLTEINEQKFRCQAKEMIGESNIVPLSIGYIYSLKDYFKDELNDDYLMLRVDSEGSQRGFLSAGFTKDGDDSSYYTNTFTMIPLDMQFRDQTTVPWPHIGGMLSAIIDGSGSGDTAELDEHGRYKVIMPFDISGRGDSKASAYLRMAQPSAGEKQGMHFPLHRGTEVLIAFKGGDPDQPIIISAVPNINSPSPVNEDNVTKSVIQTHGGNIIHMEDTPGKAHIKMAVHDDLSSITIHNKDEENKEWGIALVTKGGFKLLSADADIHILGEKFETFVGLVQSLSLADKFEVFVGLKQDINISHTQGIKLAGELMLHLKTRSFVSPEAKELKDIHTEISNNKTSITANKKSVLESEQKIAEDYTIMVTRASKLIVEDIAAIEERVSTIETDVTNVVDRTINAVDITINSIDINIDSADINIDALNMNMLTADINIDALNMNIDAANMMVDALCLTIDAPITIVS